MSAGAENTSGGAGKVCRKAGNGDAGGRVCFCSRAGDDLGKVVFKARTFDLFARCKPPRWKCKVYGVVHEIEWDTMFVVNDGARVGIKYKATSQENLFHVYVSGIKPDLVYTLMVRGITACDSPEDPKIYCSLTAKFCGKVCYRADDLLLTPRSKMFLVSFATDKDANVKSVTVLTTKRANL